MDKIAEQGQEFAIRCSQSDVLTLGLFFPVSTAGNNVALGDLVNNTLCSAGFAVSSAHRICGEIEFTFVEKQK